jgi:hypothetical protein
MTFHEAHFLTSRLYVIFQKLSNPIAIVVDLKKSKMMAKVIGMFTIFKPISPIY